MDCFATELKRIDEINGRVPHFPRLLLEDILSGMHPFAKDLLPILVLLPNQGNVSETAYVMAAVSQLIGYHRLIHSRVMNVDTPESQRAVLLGDLLSSAAYKKMVEVYQDKNLMEIADVMAATDEAWFMKEKLGQKESEAGYLEILQKEFGLLYGKIAAIGADIAGLDEEKQDMYRTLGCRIGLLWGGKTNRYPIDFAAISASIDEQCVTLGQGVSQIVGNIKAEILSYGD